MNELIKDRIKQAQEARWIAHAFLDMAWIAERKGSPAEAEEHRKHASRHFGRARWQIQQARREGL